MATEESKEALRKLLHSIADTAMASGQFTGMEIQEAFEFQTDCIKKANEAIMIIGEKTGNIKDATKCIYGESKGSA